MAKKGIKFDEKKDDWSLLPFREVREVVQILTFGATKYDSDNWKFVEPARERYFSAAMRHLTAWFTGERLDNETSKSHLAHAICCLLFLMWKDNESSLLERQ